MSIGTPPAAPALLQRQRRQPGLDLIRAAAIAWVMVYHASIMDLVPDPDHWFFSFGWMGVDLFFVLSGYLIASQLFRPLSVGSAPAYRTFMTRRLLRTLPAYAVVVAIYFLVPGIRERPLIQPFWQFATFTENLLIDISRPKAFTHVWSLCVEEQFYLVCPLAVMLLLHRPSVRKTVAALVGLLLAGMAVRGYLWLAGVATIPFDPAADPDARRYTTLIYYPTWSRLDGLLAGISMAAIQIFRPLWWARLTERPSLLLLLGAGGMTASIFLFGDQIAGLAPTIFGFPLLAASIAMVVAAASDDRTAVGRYAVPGARALATGAYSIYLTHKIAFHLVAASDVPASWARLGLAIGLALILGASLYWAIERPFLRLRDRLTGRTRTLLASASAHAG